MAARLLVGHLGQIPMKLISRIKHAGKRFLPADYGSQDEIWDCPYDTLRKKWVHVPTEATMAENTEELHKLADGELVETWESARRSVTIDHRGWYHERYAPMMRGKKVMDVGSGFGVDSITFAQHGASMTFVDLAESNLSVLKRLCNIMGLRGVEFVELRNLDSLKPLPTDYDVIMAMGSLHHSPARVNRLEYQELVIHLKSGGRWLQLAYPKSRWIRYGRPLFRDFGKITDGPATQWAEWYDVPKLLRMLAPTKFEVVLYQEFHDGDFNWFDLRRQ